MRFALPMLILGIVSLFFCSCVEAEPAEISVRCTLNGRPQGAHVQLFNAKGVQITEATCDYGGVAFVKSLEPGTYTLKFVDSQRNPYPAVITVTVASNDSQMREVELSDPTGGPKAGGAAAPTT